MSYGSTKRGYDQEGCVRGEGGLTSISGVKRRTCHKHFIVVLCKQRTTDAALSARVNACRGSLRLYFSHFATRTIDNTADLYAAKPDIRPESRFCLPHLHSTPQLGGFPSE